MKSGTASKGLASPPARSVAWKRSPSVPAIVSTEFSPAGARLFSSRSSAIVRETKLRPTASSGSSEYPPSGSLPKRRPISSWKTSPAAISGAWPPSRTCGNAAWERRSPAGIGTSIRKARPWRHPAQPWPRSSNGKRICSIPPPSNRRAAPWVSCEWTRGVSPPTTSSF